MRAALIDGEDVVNVIEYDPEADYDPAPFELVELTDEPVGPGWRRRGGVFVEPPVELLTGPAEADGGTEVVVAYRNTFDDAPGSVEFTVNGATAAVDLTDGVAELAFTMPASGDVEVAVDRDSVPPLSIREV